MNNGVKRYASEEYVDAAVANALGGDSLNPDDALALSVDMGIIEPAGNNGYVLTDANGVIYTI